MLDSDQRVSAAEALAHAYFSQYHDPDDEPEAEPYDESVEAKERTLEEWKGENTGWGNGKESGVHEPEGCLFSEQDFTCFMQGTLQNFPSGLRLGWGQERDGEKHACAPECETCKGVCVAEVWRAAWSRLRF